MKLLIMYSSRPGNTRRLAEGIATYLPEFEVSLLPVEEADALPEADAYLVGYWADRGHADEKSQALIGRLAGKKVGLFGTLGAYPYGKHARHTCCHSEGQNSFSFSHAVISLLLLFYTPLQIHPLHFACN